MFERIKKLLKAALCTVFVASFCSMSWAATNVTVNLSEFDYYSTQINHPHIGSRKVDTYNYNTYGPSQPWSGSGTLGTGGINYQRFEGVSTGTKIFSFTDRFRQPWSVTHNVTGRYTSEAIDLEKLYSTISMQNADGTPYTGTHTFDVRVGPSGLTGYNNIRQQSVSAQCEVYKNVNGYNCWVVPTIWTGGSEAYTLYILNTSTQSIHQQFTYGTLGVYGYWFDIPFTFYSSTSRGADSTTGISTDFAKTKFKKVDGKAKAKVTEQTK